MARADGRIRRFLQARRRPPAGPVAVYEFERLDHLLQGWQTHTARQRLIHEDSARRIQAWHYGLGVPAALMAALAGTSAVAAWQSERSSTWLSVLSALIAVAASVLTGVVTFLDLGGRAERHRKAAAGYKRVLRRLEALPPQPVQLTELTPALAGLVKELQSILGSLDAAAPIPPRGIAERASARPIELRSSVEFTQSAGGAPTV